MACVLGDEEEAIRHRDLGGACGAHGRADLQREAAGVSGAAWSLRHPAPHPGAGANSIRNAGPTSLYVMMLGSSESERVAYLDRLARLHSRAELDISSKLYDLWLDQLVQAVQEFDRSSAWNRICLAARAAAWN